MKDGDEMLNINNTITGNKYKFNILTNDEYVGRADRTEIWIIFNEAYTKISVNRGYRGTHAITIHYDDIVMIDTFEGFRCIYHIDGTLSK